MHSELRTTTEGKRYMVCFYNNTTGDWNAVLAAARNRHPGCGTLPVIAVSDSGRYRIEGAPVREIPLGPHRMAVEPPQPAPERARNDDQAEGVQSGTPARNDAQKGLKTTPGRELRWEIRTRPPVAGQQINFNMLISCNIATE